MSGLPVLEVRALSKRFCRNGRRRSRYALADILREVLPRRGPVPLRKDEFWAIDDLDFTIAPGEAVAIAGPNGAGKTTLMRLIAGILKPDHGEIVLGGRVNPVIELGQGLNPLLTGRENAELGLAWRGVSPAGNRRLQAEIGRFAGLDDKFDSTVDSYSSGMRLRLAFAIAVHVPCDLMLLDEVLAVGDLAFQRKCLQHMQAHLSRGGSLILVSHNVHQMQTICRRGILVSRGRRLFDGPIEDCIDRLFEIQQPPATAQQPAAADETQVHVRSLRVVPRDPAPIVRSGEELTLEMDYWLPVRSRILCAFTIWSRDVSVCITALVEPEAEWAPAGTGLRRCTIGRLPLAQGCYALRGVILDPLTLQPLAHHGYSGQPVELRVTGELSRSALLGRNNGQLIDMSGTWSGEPGDRRADRSPCLEGRLVQGGTEE